MMTEVPGHIRLKKMEPMDKNSSHPVIAINPDDEQVHKDADLDTSLMVALGLALCALLVVVAVVVRVCGSRRKSPSNAELEAHISKERRRLAVALRTKGRDPRDPAVLHVEMTSVHDNGGFDPLDELKKETLNVRSNSVQESMEKETREQEMGEIGRSMRASEPNVRYIFKHGSNSSPSSSLEEADHEVAGITNSNDNSISVNYKTFSTTNPLTERLDHLVTKTSPLKHMDNVNVRKIELVDTPDCTSIDTAIPEETGQFGENSVNIKQITDVEADFSLNQMEEAVEEGIEQWGADRSAEDLDRASEVHTNSNHVDETNPWASKDSEEEIDKTQNVVNAAMAQVVTSS